MPISRREFALGFASAAFVLAARVRARVTERRVYGQGSALPSRELLMRNGIRPASIRRTQRGVEYLISFDSLEARARAWDRVNTDAEWCELSAGGVQLQELNLYPGGKIFEMSL
jgi:hypothetical protein